MIQHCKTRGRSIVKRKWLLGPNIQGHQCNNLAFRRLQSATLHSTCGTRPAVHDPCGDCPEQSINFLRTACLQRKTMHPFKRGSPELRTPHHSQAHIQETQSLGLPKWIVKIRSQKPLDPPTLPPGLNLPWLWAATLAPRRPGLSMPCRQLGHWRFSLVSIKNTNKPLGVKDAPKISQSP